MSSLFRKMRPIAYLAATLFLLSASLPAVQGTQCSATSKCPKDSPCCSSTGICGSGALQCADGCNPMASFTAASCQPNPICVNKNITFAPTDYDDAHQFMPILLYNGNASRAPFTLDYGSLGKGPVGVLLELTEASQTRLSTTDYMLYGNVSLTARHDARAGLVFAFITMSDIKDEIDWEFTTANVADLQTNYFSQGVTSSGSGKTVNATSSNFTTSDWHTYGLNWQTDKLEWLVDGNVLRTITKADVGDNYPRSPSRIQISVWAGGNSTNEPGVIKWAGGAIDWNDPTYTSQGYFSGEIKSFQQTCAATNADPSITTNGTGTTPTSWIYTGTNSSTLNEPEYVLSTDPISYLADSSADGVPDMPGYSTQTPFTKSNSNAWDGSGDTSGLSKAELSKANAGTHDNTSSNQGGWLDNNRILSIAVPVIAGAAALFALWAICVCCSRRRRRKLANREGPLAQMNDTGAKSYDSGSISDSPSKPASMAAYVRETASRMPNNYTSSRYRTLDDADEAEDEQMYEQVRAGYGSSAPRTVRYANAPSTAPSSRAYTPVARSAYGDNYKASNYTPSAAHGGNYNASNYTPSVGHRENYNASNYTPSIAYSQSTHNSGAYQYGRAGQSPAPGQYYNEQYRSPQFTAPSRGYAQYDAPYSRSPRY